MVSLNYKIFLAKIFLDDLDRRNMKLSYQLNARFETYHPGKIELLRGGSATEIKNKWRKTPMSSKTRLKEILSMF